jgi:hypothetical protein
MEPSKNRSLAIKLSALVGAAGIAPVAHAAIITSSTLPLHPSGIANTSITWDVDGTHPSFYLKHHAAITSYGQYSSQSARIACVSKGTSKGGHLIVDGAALSQLPLLAKGSVIGKTLPAGLKVTNNQSGLQMTSTRNNEQSNFTKGIPGYFAFQFEGSNNATYYGWGELLITGRPVGQGFTIEEAYYNNIAGQSIMVGQTAVPEPSSTALLTLGATGLAAWRLRRKKAA